MKRNSLGQFIHSYGVNDEYFNTLNSTKAWILGLIASDGNIKRGGYFSISQSGDNGKKIISFIKNKIGYSGKIYVGKTYRKKSYSIQIYSPKIINELSKYGIVPVKSLIYNIPDLSEETKDFYSFLEDFLRGYIDGDGCVGIYFSGTTYSLLISLVGTENFIKKINSLVPIQGRVNKIKKARNCWELRWYGEKAIKIGEWIYKNDIYKSDKEKKYEYFLKNFFPKYIKYASLKQRARELKEKGLNVNIISKDIGLRFQTVYRWIKMGKI
jgi:hypothetical protein